MKINIGCWLVFLFVISTQMVYAQFTLVPLPRENNTKKNRSSARTQELTPMPLPFWDDFSFSNSLDVPHDTLWESGSTVTLNFGMGINPPSLGVITFDGLDASGNPYVTNDPLAKGVADQLTSRQLALDLITPAQRTGVFLSFYYQYKGNGEAPDPGDQLQVLFKNSTGAWITVRTIENNGSLDPTVFTQTLIPISGDQYYHNQFQFKIQSFGRLSGPYDTWNVDYVYVNKGRNSSDTSYPDRTISIPMASMLNGYYAMPFDHFMEDPAAHLTSPILTLHNLEFIPGNTNQSDVQPINYDSEDSVFVYRNGTETIYTHQLDLATSIGNPLQPLEFRKTSIQTPPDISDLVMIDSAARIKLKLWINSGDNIEPSIATPLGDYNSIKYAPIDFRHNDTTQVEYILDNYYAYDDGTAEYGAALNQPGALLAYYFDMKTSNPDTLVALDLYFPKFDTDETNTIEIQILKNLTGDPGASLHREIVSVQQNSKNNFWRLPLSRLVGVKDEFYVGWKQSSSTVLAVGLDKNTDSGDKIFFNINGAWEQNVNLKGSLMIRPVFGKGDGVITGLPSEEKNDIAFYPNPSRGQFTVAGKVKAIRIYDITGRLVNYTSEPTQEGQLIQLINAAPGLYILQLHTGHGVTAHRLKVD
ncbi:MAG TPA: hypothetical protein DIS90_01970 [Cytophagales bacterium]|nr:hypothetical protein [Cytophagales bacterium]